MERSRNPGRFALRAVLAMLFLTPAALANPDVWISTSYLYRTDGERVTGLDIDWEFDAFASSYLLDEVDRDGDGLVSDVEALELESDIFGPFAEFDWFLHATAGGEPAPFSVAWLDSRFDSDRLVVRLGVLFDEPVPYLASEIVTSLHDDEVFFDFSPAANDFLAVEGPLDPSCRFVVGPGEGLLAGHHSTIALRCGDPP